MSVDWEAAGFRHYLRSGPGRMAWRFDGDGWDVDAFAFSHGAGWKVTARSWTADWMSTAYSRGGYATARDLQLSESEAFAIASGLVWLAAVAKEQSA